MSGLAQCCALRGSSGWMLLLACWRCLLSWLHRCTIVLLLCCNRPTTRLLPCAPAVTALQPDCRRVQNLFHSVQLNVNNPHFLIMQGRITKVSATAGLSWGWWLGGRWLGG